MHFIRFITWTHLKVSTLVYFIKKVIIYLIISLPVANKAM